MRCPACDTENRAGQKFCGECGASLRPTAPPTAASPDRYTPKHLAERILTSRSALEGERKHVTVLFADLKGSLELLADRDPEQARGILDPVLERLMEAVHHYEGTVNQVMGDGIMALFGAPLAHEDHAVRACFAALRMQEQIRVLARELQREGLPPVAIRIGINSGEVVVRSIGSDLRMDYTAVGQTTHLAARVEQLAQPGSILLTGDTLRLAEGFVSARPLGTVPVKGLSEPVELFELTAALSGRSRLGPALARGLSAFVGREAEMASLYCALREARAGQGRRVAVVGEPGVGKSRLCYELARSHDTTGCLVLEAAAFAYTHRVGYLPVVGLLKRYFHLADADDARAIRAKVLGSVLALDKTLEPTLVPLLELLSVPTADAAWAKLDPPERRHRTIDAVASLLLRESREQPLLLLFEDLHWIDSETEAVLEALQQQLPAAPILLLVNYRPEYAPPDGRVDRSLEIRLAPLDAGASARLLTALLGSDASLDPLKTLLADMTEGNPFFIEECVSSLVETGALVRQGMGMRLTKAVSALQIPPTVQAVLAARIDRLDAEDKAFVQRAAVIGRQFSLALLAAVSGRDVGSAKVSLERLEHAEFLYQSRLEPDAEYTFKHVLTSEVAYGSMLNEQRKLLHASVLAAMEQAYSARLEDHVGALARHAVRGEVWDRAVEYLERAARKDLQRGSIAGATRLYQDAIAAAAALEQQGAGPRRRAELHFELRRPFVMLGDIARYHDTLNAAQGLAQKVDDRRLQAYIDDAQGWYFFFRGEPDRALEVLGRTLQYAREAGDSTLAAAAHYFSSFACYSLGAYGEAVAHARVAIAFCDEHPECHRTATAANLAVVSRMALAYSGAELGDFDPVLVAVREMTRIAEVDSLGHEVANALLGTALVLSARGEYESAMSCLARCGALPGIEQLSGQSALMLSFLAQAQLGLGRYDEAVHSAERALAAFDARARRAGRSRILVTLAGALAGRGSYEAASHIAQSAIAQARETQERGSEAWALLALAEIQRSAGQLDATQTTLTYTATLAQRMGMRPLAARCELEVARLRAAQSRVEDSRRHADAAAAQFEAMGMRHWSDEARRAAD